MALPDYSKGGFYNPTNPYTGAMGTVSPKQLFAQTALPSGYQTWATDTNPQGEWQHRLSEMGLGGTGPKDRAAQQLYSQAQSGYKAAQTRNYEVLWPEYLDTLDLNRLVANQSYDAQGIKGPKKYRWGMRGV